eukprot:TRINITY_DN20250_c0_g1_i1.p1 TRINITY_DN20250_c0_g1~~TRINITY_DN20250_c0_g1_i1.p1  ORF type:complete len:193 (+),score=35.45 TRINITY_DN20250_c0_g1_i1:29-580(+)
MGCAESKTPPKSNAALGQKRAPVKPPPAGVATPAAPTPTPAPVSRHPVEPPASERAAAQPCAAADACEADTAELGADTARTQPACDAEPHTGQAPAGTPPHTHSRTDPDQAVKRRAPATPPPRQAESQCSLFTADKEHDVAASAAGPTATNSDFASQAWEASREKVMMSAWDLQDSAQLTRDT